MYSNDITQIRSGLVNYTGSLLKACKIKDNKASRQFVSAILIEEAINLMKEDNTDNYDLYISKPLIRGTLLVLNNRKELLSNLQQTSIIKEKIKEYDNSIKFLNDLIKNIKHTGE